MKTEAENETASSRTPSHFIYYSLLLLFICVNCYYNSLEGKFVFDDVKAIVNNDDLRPLSPLVNVFKNDFWGTPMWKETSHKSYRPLCVLTFRLNYALGELDPTGYHLFNLIFHWLLCVLILHVFQLFLSEWSSFLMSILFAVHPVHTEAVTGIVGRAEILSSIFILLSLKSYSKAAGFRKSTNWQYIFLTIMLVVCATLCKEIGITVVAINCVYEILWLQKVTLWEGLDLAKMLLLSPKKLPPWFKTSLARMLVLIFSTAGLMAIRIKIMGAELPHFTTFDNPPSSAATPARQLTFWYLLPVNVGILLYPFALLCDYSMGTIPLLASFNDPRNLITINFVIILLFISWFALTNGSAVSRQVSMALSFMVFPFLPATNLFFPVGFVVAERILYTPSIGFTMMVVIGISVILKQTGWKKLTYTLFALTVVLHASKTIRRNIDWRSEKDLFTSGLHITTKNAKMWNNVGHSYEAEQNFEAAMKFFKQASITQPDDGGAWINLGRSLKMLNHDDEAVEAFLVAEKFMPPKIKGKSRRIDPKYLSIYLSLADIYKKDKSRIPEAIALYEKAIRMWKEYTDAYINLAALYSESGQEDKSLELYYSVLKFNPNQEHALFNLGVIALKNSNKSLALDYFERCIHFHPESKSARFNAALLREQLSINQTITPTDTLDEMQRVLKQDPNDHVVHSKLGMLYKERGDLLKAEEHLVRSHEINDTYRNTLFHLGELYRATDRPLKAFEYLKQYLQMYDGKAKAWTMMGELLLNHFKNIDKANECFQKAHQLQPESTQTSYNLCVIHVKKGEFKKAESCLSKIKRKDPKPFVVDSLEKVRGHLQKLGGQ